MIHATVADVAAPMHRGFGHARATRALAESIVVRVDWDGHVGAGECVPRDYVTGETIDSVFEVLARCELTEIASRVDLDSVDAAIRSVERLELPRRLRQGDVAGLAAACALELALLDSITQRFATNVRVAAEALALPSAVLDDGSAHRRSRAWDSTRTRDQLAEILQSVRVLKIKVGLGVDEDVERLRAARALVPADVVICVDANMAWSLDQACAMVDRLRPYDVAWYEEPLPREALADCAELRRRTGARVMLDESMCSYEQATAAIEHEACDLFNVRISKCGGMIASLRLIELAHRNGLGVQLGAHPGEQCILRAAEWQLANTVRGFVAMELAPTGSYFDEELAPERLEFDAHAGRFTPPSGPGLGIVVAPERLERQTRRQAKI